MDLPVLSPLEARVLGALVEKDLTTPEYYPLSLNALVNACNQINNRQPVLALGEAEVKSGLESLRDQRLATVISGGDNRVLKYAHRAGDALELARPELSLVAELLLRGPQTPGELRARASRMHAFADLADVQATLARLAARTPALVILLPRQPGAREARYAHLLSGPVDTTAAAPASPAPPAAATPTPAATPAPGDTGTTGTGAPASLDSARLARLESEVAALRAELESLRRRS